MCVCVCVCVCMCVCVLDQSRVVAIKTGNISDWLYKVCIDHLTEVVSVNLLLPHYGCYF